MKKEYPEIITKKEFIGLCYYLREQCALAYNRAISDLYIEMVHKNSKNLSLNDVYYKSYEIVKHSDIAKGIRIKVQSNISKTKKNDIKYARISLPSANINRFIIPFSKQTTLDKDKGFTVEEKNGDFILNMTLPEFTYKVDENKKYFKYNLIETRNKRDVKLLLSTKRRQRNGGWYGDVGTDSEVRKVMSGQLQKEWNVYADKYYNDSSNTVVNELKQKNDEPLKVRERICNLYKVSYIEIMKGKKIGEKSDWFVNMSVNIPPKNYNLDKNIIGGIDTGMKNPVVCAVSNSLKRYTVHANELLAYNIKAMAQRRTMSRKNKNSRRGHGINNKIYHVTKFTYKNQQRRKKIVEKIAKDVTDFYIKERAGIVRMEELTSIKDVDNKEYDTDFFKYQRMFWAYSMLQQQIIKKLTEAGIEVMFVNPKYTSQSCHKCGKRNEYFTFDYRSKNKFPEFKCRYCNNNSDADYNGAKYIAHYGIPIQTK